MDHDRICAAPGCSLSAGHLGEHDEEREPCRMFGCSDYAGHAGEHDTATVRAARLAARLARITFHKVNTKFSARAGYAAIDGPQVPAQATGAAQVEPLDGPQVPAQATGAAQVEPLDGPQVPAWIRPWEQAPLFPRMRYKRPE